MFVSSYWSVNIWTCLLWRAFSWTACFQQIVWSSLWWKTTSHVRYLAHTRLENEIANHSGTREVLFAMLWWSIGVRSCWMCQTRYCTWILASRFRSMAFFDSTWSVIFGILLMLFSTWASQSSGPELLPSMITKVMAADWADSCVILHSCIICRRATPHTDRLNCLLLKIHSSDFYITEKELFKR